MTGHGWHYTRCLTSSVVGRGTPRLIFAVAFVAAAGAMVYALWHASRWAVGVVAPLVIPAAAAVAVVAVALGGYAVWSSRRTRTIARAPAPVVPTVRPLIEPRHPVIQGPVRVLDPGDEPAVMHPAARRVHR